MRLVQLNLFQLVSIYDNDALSVYVGNIGQQIEKLLQLHTPVCVITASFRHSITGNKI